MKNITTLKHNLFQRISADSVLSRIGNLELQNLQTVLRGVISDRNALMAGGHLTVTTGWQFELEANSFWIQAADANSVVLMSNEAAQVLQVTPSTSQDRYDLIQARQKIVPSNLQDVDVIDPINGQISQQNYYIDNKVEMEIQVVAGTPGAGICPAITGPTSATFTGSVTINPTINLATNYNLTIKLNNTGAITVDCRGATPSATTLAEIISAINTALGVTVAYNETNQLRLTSNISGPDGYIAISPSITNDAANTILGLTITPNYLYEYVGGLGFVKIGEVRVSAGSVNLIQDDLRDQFRKVLWTRDSNTVFELLSLWHHANDTPIDHPDASIGFAKLDADLQQVLLAGSPSDKTHFNGVMRGYLDELAIEFKDSDALLTERQYRIKAGAMLVNGIFLRSFAPAGILGEIVFSPTDPVRFDTLDTRIQVGKTKGVPTPSAGDYETVDFTSGNVQNLGMKWQSNSMTTGVVDGQAAIVNLTPQKVYENGENGETLEIWDFTGGTQYTVSYNGAYTGQFDVNTTTGEITRVSLLTSIQIQIRYTYSLVREILIEADSTGVFTKEGTYSTSGVLLFPSWTPGKLPLFYVRVNAKQQQLTSGSAIHDLRKYSVNLSEASMVGEARQQIIDGGLSVMQRQRFCRVYEDIPWTRSSTTFTINIPKTLGAPYALFDWVASGRELHLLDMSDRSMFATNADFIERGKARFSAVDEWSMSATCDDVGATSGTISFAFGMGANGFYFLATGWTKTSGVVQINIPVRASTTTIKGKQIEVRNSSDAVNFPNGWYPIDAITENIVQLNYALGVDSTGSADFYLGDPNVDAGYGNVWQKKQPCLDDKFIMDNVHKPDVNGCERSWRLSWLNGGWIQAPVGGRHSNEIDDAAIFQFIEPKAAKRIAGKRVSISFWAKTDIAAGIDPCTLRIEMVGAGNKVIGTKLTGNSFITVQNCHHLAGNPSYVMIVESTNQTEVPNGTAQVTAISSDAYIVETGVVAAADVNVSFRILFPNDFYLDYLQDGHVHMGIDELPDLTVQAKHDAVGTQWVKCYAENILVSDLEAIRRGMYIRFVVPKNSATRTKAVWLAGFQMNDGSEVMDFHSAGYQLELTRTNRFVWILYGHAGVTISIGYVNGNGYAGFVLSTPQEFWAIGTYAIFYGSAMVNSAASGGNVLVQLNVAVSGGPSNISLATTQQITGPGEAVYLRTLSEGEMGSSEEASMLDVRCIPYRQ